MRSDQDRLVDILEAIESIDRHASRGKSAVLGDELVRVWIVYHLQIIGEAVRLLSPEFKSQHHEIPWTQIVGMRNLLVHEYFVIDGEAVWEAVDRNLPDLKRVVLNALPKSGTEE